MELKPIFRRVIGLDIHQAKISACALSEQSDGSVKIEMREFGGFKRDRRALAQWVREFGPEIVVMESTGIYWKSPFAALERAIVHQHFHAVGTLVGKEVGAVGVGEVGNTSILFQNAQRFPDSLRTFWKSWNK